MRQLSAIPHVTVASACVDALSNLNKYELDRPLKIRFNIQGQLTRRSGIPRTGRLFPRRETKSSPKVMTIIAYQGISGSNSELAAKQFAEEANISSPIFLPCATSAVVIEAMTKSQAAYGVIGISQLNWRK
jgi:hypothetical protein